MTPEQHKAMDVGASCWVNASAGSGKTTLLVARISALLVHGAGGGSILCLTFTKSAALEMQERLDAQMILWATCDEGVLAEHLTVLLGRTPLPNEINQARSLKEHQDKDRVHIQTFHSFCHDLLMRFPIESNLNIPLQIWDQAHSLRMWTQAYDHVLSHSDATSALGQGIGRLMALGVDIKGVLDELFHRRMLPKPAPNSVISNGSVDDFLANHPNPMPEIHDLGVPDTEFLARFQGFSRGSPEYCAVFLAKVRKKSPFHNQLLQSWYQEECAVIQKWFQAKAEKEHVQKTLDYESFFEQVLRAYHRSKQGALDFNDLTLKTLDLLEDSAFSGWVAHTLYHQIHHMLVDEAQDTSGHQWRIVRHLIEAVVINGRRSICVVGDPKQSIYGFHGADPAGFSLMRTFVEAWVLAHEGRFYDVALTVSFRSSPAILHVVNGVFQKTDVTGMVFSDHTSFYPQRPGLVELWSCPAQDVDLAEQWVKTLDTWKEKPFFLPSKNRLVQSDDIMIILPRRTSFFKSLQGQLYRSGWLKRKDIAYKDDPVLRMMVAWCRVVLCPDDDVAMAALLEGVSLFGGRSWVFDAAYQRGRGSLWQNMEQLATQEPFFAAFYEYIAFVRRQRTQHRLVDLVAQWVYQQRGGAFLSFLGPDAQEVIDIFIQALHQWHDPDDGVGFLDWIQQEDTLFKTNNPGGVTLLTIHGAKGAQAPVVILPDLPLPVDKDDREYWRLLYVAMTRAQDRLYLSSRKETPWYNTIRDAMGAIVLEPVMEKESDMLVYRYCHEVHSPCSPSQHSLGGLKETIGMPPWSNAQDGKATNAHNDYRVGCFGTVMDGVIQDSHIPHGMPCDVPVLCGQEQAGISTEHQVGASSMTAQAYSYRRRGMALHQLLDELPSVVPQDWLKTAVNFLNKQGLAPSQSRYWAARVVDLLGRSDLRPLFFEARAEVEWVGHQELRRMDRLLIRQNQIWIVDFKSDDNGADTPWGVMPYAAQMQRYVDLVKALYPAHRIHQGILWLKSGILQWHPDDHGWHHP
jgi:ATP-dependent helicase/nuclease subunit A